MFDYKPSKKFKVISLGLLVILNVILRIPSIPHAKGRDSFFIQSLANTINTFGDARWWDHWLSVFGYFPYSYASGLPFTLSGISQLCGINVEKAILIYSIIFGVLTIFFAYILAGLILNNFIYKYIMALFFSISPGIMIFTTWEASARGPFMIFLPLLLFLLLAELSIFKKAILSVLCLVFLFSLHHYAIFALVLTLLYVTTHIFTKMFPLLFDRFDLQKYAAKANYLYLFLLISSFMYPFLSHSMITAGSRYGWIISLVITNARFIGPAILLTIGGVVSISLSPRKNYIQWYFLISFIFMVPFLYDLVYGMYLLLLYAIVFLSIGFKNAIFISSNKTGYEVKIVAIFVVSMILISTFFTAFYNHNRTGDYSDLWYLDGQNYDLANWINYEIAKDSRVFMVAENNYIVRTIALQENGSSILVGGVTGLAYGFVNASFLDELERVPATSSYFYSEGPYKVEERDIFRSVDWYVLNKDINDIDRVYSPDYYVQSRTYYKRINGLTSDISDIIYNNGVHEIYVLD